MKCWCCIYVCRYCQVCKESVRSECCLEDVVIYCNRWNPFYFSTCSLSIKFIFRPKEIFLILIQHRIATRILFDYHAFLKKNIK